MKTIDHQEFLHELETSLADFKLTALLGPRGVGKTRLARMLELPEANFLNLDDPMVQARLEHPEEVLGELRGLVVIDGFQRQPELLPVLFELAKGWIGPSRFLLIGRTSLRMMKGLDGSLADEVNVIRMGGLTGRGLGFDDRDRLWLRGGFPGSFFAATDEESADWRDAYLQTYLRRGLPDFGIEVPPARLSRFLAEVARRHGETWNSSAVASSVGVSHPTARSYLDLLTETFMLRQLRPMTGLGSKRTVKAPKVYLRDSGLLHCLIGIATMDDLESSPLHAASWKGFGIEQLASSLSLGEDELFFWATHGGAGIDLVVIRNGRRFGFEFSLRDRPRATHSMTIAMTDLDLEKVYLVHPGKDSFPLRDGMEAMGYADLADFKL